MTDPLDTNDDWAELAREFAIDKPPAPVHDERAEAPEPRPDDETAPESAEAESDDEFEDAEEAPAGEAGTEGGGDPGTGRKRRRRRRRRRKGAPGDAAPVAGVTAGRDDTGAEAEDPDEPEEVEAVAETEDFAAPASDDREEVEDFDPEPVPLAAEEDTANDVLRELIATWNVPSWDSIVSGLYRPN